MSEPNLGPVPDFFYGLPVYTDPTGGWYVIIRPPSMTPEHLERVRAVLRKSYRGVMEIEGLVPVPHRTPDEWVMDAMDAMDAWVQAESFWNGVIHSRLHHDDIAGVWPADESDPLIVDRTPGDP